MKRKPSRTRACPCERHGDRRIRFNVRSESAADQLKGWRRPPHAPPRLRKESQSARKRTSLFCAVCDWLALSGGGGPLPFRRRGPFATSGGLSTALNAWLEPGWIAAVRARASERANQTAAQLCRVRPITEQPAPRAPHTRLAPPGRLMAAACARRAALLAAAVGLFSAVPHNDSRGDLCDSHMHLHAAAKQNPFHGASAIFPLFERPPGCASVESAHHGKRGVLSLYISR